ncbi:MAG: hypothetical protein QOG14_992 [Mycobacterium sp.]|jgi:hypothetical protein|nr:hypothetical protein [Mycobacterium sp.]
MGASKSKLLSQIWLPTLVLIVVVAAGFAINAARGFFGSQDRTQSPGSKFAVAAFDQRQLG